MRIEPYDGDNQKMYVYNPEDMFIVSLENEDTTSSISCSTTQPTSDGDPDFYLSAACNIPDLSKAEGAAGEWELVVTLNLVTVFTKRVERRAELSCTVAPQKGIRKFETASPEQKRSI